MKWFLITSCLLLLRYSVNAQQQEGDALYQSGNYTKAIKAYSKDTTIAYNQRMMAKAYHELENYELAIIHYQKAIALDSTLPLQKFELAKLYFQTKKFDESIALYKQLIKEDQTNPGFFYYLGVSCEYANKKPEAYQYYQTAYNLDKNYLKASYKLAAAALLNEEYDRCMELMEEGLKINPNHIDFINLRAIYHYDVMNYKEAIPWFEKLIGYGQESASIYRRLGICYYNNFQYEEALKAFEKQQAYDPYNPEIFLYYGKCYVKLKEMEKAETCFQQAIILKQQGFAEEYTELAVLYNQEGKFAKSLEYYKKIKDENPNTYLIDYSIAVTADKLNIAPDKKLAYFEEAEKHTAQDYFKKLVTKRIEELKTEIGTKTN